MDRLWSRLALGAAGVLAALWILQRFSTLAVMAVIVGIVTFPIYPVVDWLEQRARLSRGVAAGLTLVVLMAILGLGVVGVFPWAMGQVRILLDLTPRGIRAVAEVLSAWQARVDEPTFPGLLRAAWERAGEAAVTAANSVVTRTVNLAVRSIGQLYLLLLLPFVIYFVLLDYRSVRETILSLVREPHRTRIADLLGTLTTTLRWGLWAQVVVSTIVGVMTALGLAIVGVPGAWAIGIFSGIAEAIPYVGGFATYGVALVAAVPRGGSEWVWAMLVVTVVKVAVNVMVPWILGRFTRTHPLAIIMALLVLAQLFGVIGMFFAVPVVVVVREVFAWWRQTAGVQMLQPEGAVAGKAPV
ncbi:MAG: AI-2E family transporter [Armatimonadota bacterium]|nr:AI-2E family transporter [Armatimonadota bacterium]